MYNTNASKLLIAHLFEKSIHQGDLTIIDEVFSPHFVDHSTPAQPEGPQGVKDYFTSVRIGFPDIQVTLDDLIAEGDKVAVRSTWRGTHLGLYGVITPTGKKVTRTLIQIFFIRNGKIEEEWNEGKDLLT